MQPRYLGITDTYKRNANNKDIRAAIIVAVPKATQQMKKMAKMFKGANEQQTCQNIFNFLLHNIQYKADGENQIIKYPSALLHTKQGDCKSYSLFTAAVLNNLNIPCHFVLQSFSSDPTPSHIYCATDNGILIDAVYKQFNKEKLATYKYNIPIMKVTHMSGIANSGAPVNGFKEWWKKEVAAPVRQAANYVKEEIEDLNLKKYTLSIPRQVVLGLFSLNVDGIASKVERQNSKSQWERKWISFGGDPAALFRAIRDGASKREKNLGLLNKLKSWIISKVGINGIGATQAQNEKVKKSLAPGGSLNGQWETLIYAGSAAAAEAISSAVGAPGAGTASSPVLAQMILSNTNSIVDMLFPIDSPGQGAPGLAPTTPNAPALPPADAAAKKDNTMLLLGGAAIAAGAIIYMANKKSK
jgi:hypothetical protein